MLKNAALIVKIGVDTAENEPQKEGCVVAQCMLQEEFSLALQRPPMPTGPHPALGHFRTAP